MPARMHIDNDSSADRYSVALSIITGGHAVAFPGFSLALCDDTLRFDVDYPKAERDELLAQRLVDRARENLESLFGSQSEYRSALSRYSRRTALVYDYGNGAVEIAELAKDRLMWK